MALRVENGYHPSHHQPGTIMAMGWLTRPSIMVYGGTLKHGNFEGNSYDIVSASRCVMEEKNEVVQIVPDLAVLQGLRRKKEAYV